MSTFGKITPWSTVEKYFLELADKWFEEYIAEVERQLGEEPRTFPDLADYGFAVDEKLPEEQLPFLQVNFIGLNDRPTKDGQGKYRANPVFAASIVVSGPTKNDVRYAMHAYGAAFKLMVLQHRSLEHPADIGGVTWLDERPLRIPGQVDRSLGAMSMFFMVDAKDVLDERGTTPEAAPRPDPYVATGDPVVIDEAGPVTINQREIEQ